MKLLSIFLPALLLGQEQSTEPDPSQVIFHTQVLNVKDNQLTPISLGETCDETSPTTAFIAKPSHNASIYPFFVEGQVSFTSDFKPSTGAYALPEFELVPAYFKARVQASLLWNSARSQYDRQTENVTSYPGDFSPQLLEKLFVLITEKVDVKRALVFVPPPVDQGESKTVMLDVSSVCGGKAVTTLYIIKVTNAAQFNSFALVTFLVATLIYAL